MAIESKTKLREDFCQMWEDQVHCQFQNHGVPQTKTLKTWNPPVEYKGHVYKSKSQQSHRHIKPHTLARDRAQQPRDERVCIVGNVKPQDSPTV